MSIKTMVRGVYKDRCTHIWGKWYRDLDTNDEFRVCKLCGESQVVLVARIEERVSQDDS